MERDRDQNAVKAQNSTRYREVLSRGRLFPCRHYRDSRALQQSLSKPQEMQPTHDKERFAIMSGF